jgi:hypothetical protein
MRSRLAAPRAPGNDHCFCTRGQHDHIDDDRGVNDVLVGRLTLISYAVTVKLG